MERWTGRVALVTGASSGIGEAICKALVDSGMIVVGAARRVEKIQNLADSLKDATGSLIGIECDLAKDEDIYNLFDQIKNKYEGVDICINSAAYSHDKSLLDGTPEQWRGMTNVNVIALCLCTKLAIASMRERDVDDGQIININSTGGHQVPSSFPEIHFAAATKFAVRAITEGLRQEMRGLKSHIRITEISPGAVQTEFFSRMAGEEKAKMMLEAFSFKFLSAEDIADSVLHVIRAPPHVEINEMIIRPTEQPF